MEYSNFFELRNWLRASDWRTFRRPTGRERGEFSAENYAVSDRRVPEGASFVIHDISDHELRKGFTLVELLVSMGILLFMTALTATNITKADRNEFLRFGARRLADAIGSSQSFAQSGTLAQYETAQSYGVHTDSVSQQIVLYADQNISSGVGHWDGGTADATGKKDEPMQDALTYDVKKKGDVKLESIMVAYRINGGAEQTAQVTSVDIASVPPSAAMVFAGGADFPSAPADQTLTVERVIFTIKQASSGKTSAVVVHALSGRIDVDY